MTLASFYTLALQTKEMFWQPNVCDTKKPFQAVSHQQKLPTWQQGLLPATALSLLLTISARSALWRRLPSRALALGTCYYSCSCRGASRSGLSTSAFGVDRWGALYILQRPFAWVHYTLTPPSDHSKPPKQWELLITALRVIQGPLQCERSIGLTDDITKSSVTLSLQLLYWSHLSQFQTLSWG